MYFNNVDVKYNNENRFLEAMQTMPNNRQNRNNNQNNNNQFNNPNNNQNNNQFNNPNNNQFMDSDYNLYPRWPYEMYNRMYDDRYENYPIQQPYYNEPNWNRPVESPNMWNNRRNYNYMNNLQNYNRDIELMHLLYTNINKELYPIVIEILNQYEYDGSPLYDEYIDRETISQLTDIVLKRAAELSDDVQETMLDEGNSITSDYHYMWNKENMLKSIAELLIMHEIFSVRRPYYRNLNTVYTNKNN